MHQVRADADRPDATLLAPTLVGLDKRSGLPEVVTIHLDRTDESKPEQALLACPGCDPAVACTGASAPVQAAARWRAEWIPRWMSGNGKLRRGTEAMNEVVDR